MFNLGRILAEASVKPNARYPRAKAPDNVALLPISLPAGARLAGPVKFGAATVNPRRFVFAGQGTIEGANTTLVMVAEGDDYAGADVDGATIAMVASDAETANEMVKLLRYVLEGRIDRETYERELAELENGDPTHI
jgi:hypothetical protein